MATARDIVERAYRKIALKAEDEAITGDMLEHGIETLNSMIFGWELFGVDTEHTALASTDTLPLAARFEEGTVYQLASRLSPDFLVPAPDADMFFRALQAAYMVIEESTINSAIIRVPSRLEGRNATSSVT